MCVVRVLCAQARSSMHTLMTSSAYAPHLPGQVRMHPVENVQSTRSMQERSQGGASRAHQAWKGSSLEADLNLLNLNLPQ